MVSTSIDSNLTTMVSTSIDTNPTIKKKSTGRKKIEIKKIEKNDTLQVTFSKRRAGLFKKASELCILTGAQIAIFVKSPAGRIYVFGHPDANALIEKYLQEKNNDNVSLPMPPKNDFNQRYKEFLREFETENKRNEMIVSSGGNDDVLCYDEPIDAMGLGELENYLRKLQEDKYNGSNDDVLCYDEPIDAMGLGELENYLRKLQEDKYNVEYRANELMIKNFYQG